MRSSGTRIVSTTASSGRPNVCPAACDGHHLSHQYAEGEGEANRGSLAGHAARFDVAAQSVDRRADRVQAHTSAGQLRDRGRRREARRKDQVGDFRVAHGRERFARYHAAFLRNLANLRDVDSAAVVRDFDQHVLPFAKSAQEDRRDGGLACGGACRRRLDAMVHRIAEHVHERLHEDFDDGLVRLRVFALEGQRYGLAQLGRHLAYQPGKSLKGGAQWQDAHAENGSLQLADEAGEGGLPVLQRHGECGTVVLCELDGVADRVFRDGELAGQPDERIDSVGGYAQCLRAAGAAACGGRLSRASRSARRRAPWPRLPAAAADCLRRSTRPPRRQRGRPRWCCRCGAARSRRRALPRLSGRAPCAPASASNAT